MSLDGSTLAESALEPATQLLTALAGPARGELHLLRVVDLPSAYGRMKSQAHISDSTHEVARQEAATYVTTLARRLSETTFAGSTISVSSSTVDSTDVAGTIIKTAEATGEDGFAAIVIATHGRGGLRRVFMGSVAEHLLGHTGLPLLIVRPAEHEPREGKSDAGKDVEVTEVEGQQTWIGLL